MAIKVQGQTVVGDDRKGSFQVTNPGQFTTAQRDALTPVTGDTIFNIDESALQIWDGTEWGSAGGADSGLDPAINSVTLTENEAGDPRFTNQTFTSTAGMFQEGVPVSTKSIKAKVIADFSVYPETNAIDTVSVDTSLVTLNTISTNTSSDGTAAFNWVNPNTKLLECYYFRNNDNSNTDVFRASDSQASSFVQVKSGEPLDSPYATSSSGGFVTPDEAYVNVF